MFLMQAGDSLTDVLRCCGCKMNSVAVISLLYESVLPINEMQTPHLKEVSLSYGLHPHSHLYIIVH